MYRVSDDGRIDPDKCYPIGEAALLTGRARQTLARYNKNNPRAFPCTYDLGGRKMFSGELLLKLRNNKIKQV